MSLVESYLDTVIGGSIWEGITVRENEYWRCLLSNQHHHENPVEGLIDITDHLVELQNHHRKNHSTSGYHIPGNWSCKYHPGPHYKKSVNEFVKELGDNPYLAVAGGAAISQAVGSPFNDIDMFLITGADDLSDPIKLVEWSKNINRYAKSINDSEYFFLSEHSISLRDEFNNKVQIVLRAYQSLTQVLMGFDIGICGIGIYRGRTYATESALYGLINNVIMISMNKASTTYIRRLIKYAKKGYNLFVEGVSTFTNPSNSYLREDSISRMEFICAKIQGRWHARNADRMIGPKSDYTGEVKTIKKLPLVHNIMFKSPHRQGSMSYYPIEIELTEWTGTNHVTFGSSVENGHIDAEARIRMMRSRASKILELISDYQGRKVINYDQLIGVLQGQVELLLIDEIHDIREPVIHIDLTVESAVDVEDIRYYTIDDDSNEYNSYDIPQ